MRSILFLLIVCFCWMQASAKYNCTSCEQRICPKYLTPCKGHRAIDPCGCCEHCAKQETELCGGPDWELGYCDRNLKCVNFTGIQLVEIPNVGVCKGDLPDQERIQHYAEHDDMNCPEQTGCYRVMGTCDCVSKHTCLLDFSFATYNRLYCDPSYDDPTFDHLFQYQCTRIGCDIVDDNCVCTSGSCDRTSQFSDLNTCYKTLMKSRCENVTCPEPTIPTCPKDSVLSKAHTPFGQCCPTITSFCTCNFDRCPKRCPDGKRKVTVWKTDGKPGSCCDQFMCLL